MKNDKNKLAKVTPRAIPVDAALELSQTRRKRNQNAKKAKKGGGAKAVVLVVSGGGADSQVAQGYDAHELTTGSSGHAVSFDSGDENTSSSSVGGASKGNELEGHVSNTTYDPTKGVTNYKKDLYREDFQDDRATDVVVLNGSIKELSPRDVEAVSYFVPAEKINTTRPLIKMEHGYIKKGEPSTPTSMMSRMEEGNILKGLPCCDIKIRFTLQSTEKAVYDLANMDTLYEDEDDVGHELYTDGYYEIRRKRPGLCCQKGLSHFSDGIRYKHFDPESFCTDPDDCCYYPCYTSSNSCCSWIEKRSHTYSNFVSNDKTPLLFGSEGENSYKLKEVLDDQRIALLSEKEEGKKTPVFFGFGVKRERITAEGKIPEQFNIYVADPLDPLSCCALYCTPPCCIRPPPLYCCGDERPRPRRDIPFSYTEKNGYAVFRLHKSCVAVLTPTSVDSRGMMSDGEPVLLTEEGIYVVPMAKKSKLELYNLASKEYSDNKNLKWVHMPAGKKGFFYDPAELELRKDEAKITEVHLSSGRLVMKEIGQQGINVLYDPERRFRFYSEGRTSKGPTIFKKPKPDEKLAYNTTFLFSNQGKEWEGFEWHQVEIPRDKVLHYIKSYGVCRIVKLEDSDPSPINSNPRELAGGADIVYVIHRNNLYLIDIRASEQLKRYKGVHRKELERLENFLDLKVGSRNLYDSELLDMKRILGREIKMKSVLDYFEGGGTRKEFFYFRRNVTLLLPDKLHVRNDPWITFAEYIVARVALNKIAVLQPLAPSAMVQYGYEQQQGVDKKTGTAIGDEGVYSTARTLKVYSAGTLFMSRHAERIVGIWPITERSVEFTITQASRGGPVLQFSGTTSYIIRDAIRAVIPHIEDDKSDNVERFNEDKTGIELGNSFLEALDDHVANIIHLIIGNHITFHTSREMGLDLVPNKSDMAFEEGGASTALEKRGDKSSGLREEFATKIEEQCKVRGLHTYDFVYNTELADPEFREEHKKLIQEKFRAEFDVYNAHVKGRATEIRANTMERSLDLQRQALEMVAGSDPVLAKFAFAFTNAHLKVQTQLNHREEDELNGPDYAREMFRMFKPGTSLRVDIPDPLDQQEEVVIRGKMVQEPTKAGFRRKPSPQKKASSGGGSIFQGAAASGVNSSPSLPRGSNTSAAPKGEASASSPAPSPRRLPKKERLSGRSFV